MRRTPCRRRSPNWVAPWAPISRPIIQLADEPLPAGSDADGGRNWLRRPSVTVLSSGLRFARQRRRPQVRGRRKRPVASHRQRDCRGRIYSVHQYAAVTARSRLEYEGIAANVSIPIFNGHLFTARREAAYQRALEADQRLRDQQQRISRDVRVAWASATDAYQRIDVTAQFLRQATLALQLAQGRYDLSLASIVELTQAQLNVTEAEIENLNAKYDYQTQYSALQYTLGLLR